MNESQIPSNLQNAVTLSELEDQQVTEHRVIGFNDVLLLQERIEDLEEEGYTVKHLAVCGLPESEDGAICSHTYHCAILTRPHTKRSKVSMLRKRTLQQQAKS